MPSDFRAPSRPEVLALIEEIKEHPDDNAVRLILCDYLEEQVDPADRARGEFVRLEGRHDPLPEEDDDAEAPERGEREQALLTAHSPAWLGPLYALERAKVWMDEYRDQPLTPEDRRAWWFQRGLVRLILPLQTFLSEPIQALAGTETWAWVEALTVQEPASAAVERLAASPLLGSLKHLRVGSHGLRNEGLPADGAHALLSSPYLTRLTSLVLSTNSLVSDHRLDEETVTLLAESPLLGQLRYLNLGNCGLTSEAVARLAASPRLAQLTALDLDNQAIGDEGVVALARSPYLTRLTWLGLFATGIGDKALQALAKSPYLGNLENLNLARNFIGDRGARALLICTTEAVGRIRKPGKQPGLR
jgi:uncharacterized protein (TIGR02996 family)